MVLDGLRGYLQLATGLTDVTRERALAAAKALAAQGEASVGVVVPESVRTQVSALADDLVATSKANRDLLVSLVRVEVERSVARLGLTPGQQTAQPSSPSGGTGTARTAKKTARTAKKTAKKAAKKTTKKAAKKTAKRAVTRSAAKKSTAKKVAKKSAKKSTAKKSTAKRSAS